MEEYTNSKIVGQKAHFPYSEEKGGTSLGSSDSIQMIDVGNDIYFVRFQSLEDYDFALTGGPLDYL